MSFRLIIFFLFAVTSNLCAANQEQDVIKKYTLSEKYFKTRFSEVSRLFHRQPDLRYLPPHGIISFIPETNHTPNSQLIRIKVKNSFKKKEYQLNLVPVKHNVISDKIPKTVTYIVESTPNTHPNYTYFLADLGGMHLTGKFYEDAKMMAMLQVIEKDGFNYYDGAIGESLNSQIVRPFPEKWKDKISSITHEDHLVYKRSADASDEYPEKFEETLYPKLTVVVDYTLFEAFGFNTVETFQYVSTFWNAVNLKYSVFQKPKIKIMVTNIIIVRDATAAHYIYQAERDAEENHESVKLSNTILTHGRLYYSKQFINDTGIRNYDGTILMTASKTSYLGLAYLGTICSRSFSFAYVHDVGDYAGVSTAAHELAHLLNVNHDDKENEDCMKFQKNSIQDDEVGTVMDSAKHYVQEYVWTDCSKAALEKLISQESANCLRTKFRSV